MFWIQLVFGVTRNMGFPKNSPKTRIWEYSMSWGKPLFNVFIGSSQFAHDNKTQILLIDFTYFTRFSASMRKKNRPQRANPSRSIQKKLFCDFRTNYFALKHSDYSHSIVPIGLGVRSSSTRLTPSTSWVMRSVMWCSRG